MLLSRNSSVTSHEDTASAFASTNNTSASNDSPHDHIMSYDHQHHHLHNHMALTGRLGDRVELCCNRCGNFVQIVNSKNLTKEELIRRENNFKCDKCVSNKMNRSKKLNINRVNGHSDEEEHSDDIDHDDDEDDGVVNERSSDNAIDRAHDDIEDEDDDADIGIDDDMDDDIDNEDVDLVRDDDDEDIDNDCVDSRLPKVDKVTAASTTTLLKDNNTKPILKFSVSAILGDTREGVRVRNGEIFCNDLKKQPVGFLKESIKEYCSFID